MSEHIDEMFAALGADADALPLSAAAAVRRLGERHRRSRLVAAVAAVVVGILAVTAAGTWWARRPAASPPAVLPSVPASSVAFTRLGAVGHPANPFPTTGKAAARIAMAAVAGGRGFTAWQGQDGQLWIGAVDLATGTAAWAPRTVGRFGDWNGVLAVPQAAVMIGEYDDGRTPDYQLIVLDPATGAVRWRSPFDINSDDLLFYDSGLLLAERPSGRTRLLDWHTGAARWTATSPGGEILNTTGMQVPAELAEPGAGAFGPRQRDHRFVQVTADKVVRVYDAETGRLQANWPVAATGDLRQARYLGYDGTVYEVAGGQLRAYRPGAQGALLASLPGEARDMAPCGTGLLCVLTGDLGTAAVTAVDPLRRREVWHAGTPNAGALVPVADRLAVTGGRGADAATLLFDAGGRQLLPAQDRATTAGRVGPGGLLLWRSRADASGNAVTSDVVGLGIDGTRTALGQIPASGGLCGWTERYLLCATVSAFQEWRFAAG